MLRRLPFPIRVGLRRVPASLIWLKRPRPERASEHDFPHVQARRRTPLRRQSTLYADRLQRAKEHNVARAAQLMDGVVLQPGASLSWHDVIGPPVRARGFVPGPELHADQLAEGGGGGLCQVANLAAWLAVHAGLELPTRHRHGLDLFPDEARTVPFGLGATVFFPTRDLVLRNPHDQPVRLGFQIVEGHLVGEARLASPLDTSFHVEERDARFERIDGVVYRFNRLVRVHEHGEEPLWSTRARVAYPVSEELL